MNLSKEIFEIIKKKALGFTYTEESVECETVRPKPYVFCEKRRRVYLTGGYFKVLKKTRCGEIVALEHKKIKNFNSNKKILNCFKSFKLKEFQRFFYIFLAFDFEKNNFLIYNEGEKLFLGEVQGLTMVLKKNVFDICAGDCASCTKRGVKNLSMLTCYTKKKILKKYVPPDMGAVKLLMDIAKQENKDISNMTDAELKSYEKELIKLLEVCSREEKTTDEGDQCVEIKWGCDIMNLVDSLNKAYKQTQMMVLCFILQTMVKLI